MRRLWIRLVLWYNGVCPQHGLAPWGTANCRQCLHKKRKDNRARYAALCKELGEK